MWTKRRRYAADYVAWLGNVQPDEYRADLAAAASALAKEVEEGLAPLVLLYPMGADPSTLRDSGRVREGQRLLEAARQRHEEAMVALRRVAATHLGLDPELSRELFEGQSPKSEVLLAALSDTNAGVRMFAVLALGAVEARPSTVAALEKAVGDPHMHVAEAALRSLARLAPADLDSRLARLMSASSRERKVYGDGPIQRHILFELSRLPGKTATEAIAAAVSDPGTGDDVAPAIAKWAAQLLRDRDPDRAREVFREASGSSVPHVRFAALAHLADMDDPAALSRLVETLAASDDGEAMQAASTLAGLGPRAEDAVLACLEPGGDPRVVSLCARILARMGTEKSLPALERLARAAGESPFPPLEDLKKRLGHD